MLEIKSFNLRREVENIFVDGKLTEEAYLCFALELYKFKTRDEILQVLSTEYPSDVFENISEINHPNELSALECKHNVLIDLSVPGIAKVITSVFKQPNLDYISFSLSDRVIKCVYVTEINFNELKQRITKEITELHYDPVILFKRLVLECMDLGATDIHFNVIHVNKKPQYRVCYRQGADMRELNLFPITQRLNKDIIYQVVEYMTSANSLDIDSKYGVVAVIADLFGDHNVSVRLGVTKAVDGFNYVGRIIQKSTVSLTIDELGFPEDTQRGLNILANKHSGITFITGAIRTGKNTTQYAIANQMVKRPIEIVDFSSPTETLMPITQVDYLADTDRLLNLCTLAKKQDIDVVLLNEIPSKDVAFAVKDLANSSVYVITTLHIDRLWHLPYKLYEYYGDGYKDIISQINGVVNQKMYGVLCPYCTETHLTASLPDERKRDFLLKHDINSVLISSGCSKCTTESNGIITFGNLIGKVQPYAEYLLFNERIKSELLSCLHPYEMENILKQELIKGKSSLEFRLAEGIRQGKLSIDSLDDIL